MKRFFSFFLILTLVALFWTPGISFSEELSDEEETVTYFAVASSTLKIRRAADINANGCGSIQKNNIVYILEYGDTWCKVKQGQVTGWVQTQYLRDVTETTGNESFVQQETTHDPQTDPDISLEMNEESYEAKYQASTVKSSTMYNQPSADAKAVTKIASYEELTVGEISGDWAYCCYNDRYYGYVDTDNLFKWDRLDPYAGDIPGLDVWSSLAFVNSSTDIFDYDSGECLKTINPGAAIAVSKDGDARYRLGYYRQYGYILSNHVAYTVDTVPYESAESGDLLSVMTTYYPVGVTTLQQQGRNWNIRLASTFITGTVLQPGETFNMNECIAPYSKSTGYKSAPIMSPHALTGYGGGTCQVNTTFYNATIALPLLVTHRRVHADSGIYYCKKGFDAAVGGGQINLIMENTLPYAIRYHMFISDGVLTCCIFKN